MVLVFMYKGYYPICRTVREIPARQNRKDRARSRDAR